MWVKGTLLHFIIDNASQNNLISAEVIKHLTLPTTPHPQPYTIGWIHPPSAISLISAKQCGKVVSQTGKFVFFLIHSQNERKITATTKVSAVDLSTQ
jgi:hypothetical protein